MSVQILAQAQYRSPFAVGTLEARAMLDEMHKTLRRPL